MCGAAILLVVDIYYRSVPFKVDRPKGDRSHSLPGATKPVTLAVPRIFALRPYLVYGRCEVKRNGVAETEVWAWIPTFCESSCECREPVSVA